MKKIICLLTVLCILLSLAPVVYASESAIYISASDFKNNPGTWMLTDGVEDASGGGFLHYLKSPKPGEGKSAQMAFELPESGDYYIYAFTRDYATKPGSRWFSISVNGKMSDRKYGTHGTDGWDWECGSPVTLEKGVNTVEIIDSGRNYGRVMTVVITKDADFKGPTTQKEMENAYKNSGAKIVEISADEPENAVATKPYDVSADKAVYVMATDFENHLGSWDMPDPVKDGAGGVVPYLKSPKPAEASPAMVSIDWKESGTFHLYAFTRDYASNQGGRRFNIAVNGNDLGKYFGTHGSDGWAWEYGGEIMLKEKVATIEIVDSSRNYGRVSAIALVPQKEFDGPHTAEEFASAAEQHHATVLDEVIIPAPELEIEEEVEVLPSYIPQNIAVQDARPNDEIAVMLNGKYLVFADDSKPFVQNDRTLVPFRAIFEAMACTVSWDDQMRTAMGNRDNISISLPVGNNLAMVSGENVYLDQPAILSNSRVMVPIRFVAESLGATVGWDDATQTVIIYADIPEQKDNYLILPESFSSLGSWTAAASGNGSFDTGTMTGGSQNKPELTSPAKAYFTVAEAGSYKVWVHARDYATNQPGTRFFNVAVNGVQLSKTFGQHGKEGYTWEDAGVVTLNSGENLLELLDTADFFGRCDAVIVTKDTNGQEPSKDLNTLKNSAKLVQKRTLENDLSFPAYAKEEGTVLSQNFIENESLRVDFYTVNTSNGQVVQSEITSKTSGAVTKARTEEFAVLLLSADRATLEQPLMGRQIFSSAYTDFYGTAKSYYGANIYRAANMYYLIPNSVSVNENKAYLTFETDLGDVTAVWSLEGDLSLLNVTATLEEQGYYSLGVFEGNELCAEDVLNANEIVADPGVITVGTQGVYVKNGIQKGVETDFEAGICMRGPTGNFRATAFYPMLGTPESFTTSGASITTNVKIISK